MIKIISSYRLRAICGLVAKLLTTLLFVLPVSQLHASPVGIQIDNLRYQGNVKSLAEIRWNKLTRQGWDISCGAAALSTLLTYHNEQPFSEMAITLSILKNSDPALVRKRGGFSLFDLKRFINAIGLEGVGFGDMTLDDLDNFDTPAILPVSIRDFDHFVIFRKRLGNKIIVGDPAFGNLSLSVDKFLRMWQSRIAFYAVSSEEKQRLTDSKADKAISALSPRAIELSIPDPVYTHRIVSRISSIPLTRRKMIQSP